MNQKQLITTCSACSLLCDDIVVSSDGSVDTYGCEKGALFFQIDNNVSTAHYVGGKPSDLASAVSRSVEILCQSRAPLICGLNYLSADAQQIAWKIADRIGATIDTTFTNQGRSGLFSLQRVGKVTASLGEISQRSDLILFWFCDPLETHPRLLERLGRPRTKRRIVAVGKPESMTALHADWFLEVSADREAEVLSVLQAQLLRVDALAQIESPQLIELAELLGSASYGSIFYGQTTKDSAFDLANESLAALIRTLNQSTRFVGMKLRTDSNAISAENMLAWSSGCAMAVNHAANFPRSNWLEYSAETILTRGECDAVLFAAGLDLKTALAGLSKVAQQHLASVPRIAISPTENLPVEVSIATGITGINVGGELCRNDDVMMPLQSLATLGEVPPPKPRLESRQTSTSLRAAIALQAIYDALPG